MENRRLGNHGLEVPALCLGIMNFGLQLDEKTRSRFWTEPAIWD